MLTGELVRPRLKRRGSALSVDMLAVADRHWQRTARDLIWLFETHISKTRAAWHASLEAYEGDRVDYIVIRGLAKVLEDSADFSMTETPYTPADVRARLFARGPAFTTSDLFNPKTRGDILTEMAHELHTTSIELEQALFADRLAEYTLTDVGCGWTPESLLGRYNLELARGVLYWASEMRVEIHDKYKDFWRYLKLFKLMFEASPLPDGGGYAVRLDGPISPFISSTIRYGRQFAAFLPALFLGTRWRMTADIRGSYSEEPMLYSLDSTLPLQSHFKGSSLFDSKLEEDFAAQFEEKFGDKGRGQWILNREDEVLLLGDTVMIPDFSVTNREDGRRALVELMGYWHPDYLRRKIAKVRAAGLHNLVLLVRESANLTPDKLADIPGEVVYFPNKPVLKEVMAAVEVCAM